MSKPIGCLRFSPRKLAAQTVCYALLLGAGLLGGLASKAAEPPRHAVTADPSHGTGGDIGVTVNSYLRVDLRKREFRLVVPQTINPATPAPLLFAFHGRGDTVESMSKYTELDKLAEKEKFILVYPVGSRQQWRITPGSAGNDLEFFDDLYEKIASQYNVDRNRVFAVGMSNGAFFTHLLASRRPQRVAAIVSHSGGIGLVGQQQPQLARKYAVMIVHGPNDDVISIETARESRDVYKQWGHTVEYVELPKRGHEWGLKEGINDKLWKFLSEHPLEKPR